MRPKASRFAGRISTSVSSTSSVEIALTSAYAAAQPRVSGIGAILWMMDAGDMKVAVQTRQVARPGTAALIRWNSGA